jgi:hypothetical protein
MKWRLSWQDGVDDSSYLGGSRTLYLESGLSLTVGCFTNLLLSYYATNI